MINHVLYHLIKNSIPVIALAFESTKSLLSFKFLTRANEAQRGVQPPSHRKLDVAMTTARAKTSRSGTATLLVAFGNEISVKRRGQRDAGSGMIGEAGEIEMLDVRCNLLVMKYDGEELYFWGG